MSASRVWRSINSSPTPPRAYIPGDALNVGLVGSETEVAKAFAAAGWYPADAITWRTSLAITGSVLLDRSYPRAPVSNLYYAGRRQDLAFEQPVG